MVVRERKLTAQEIVDLSREFTFFSWSVQGETNPIPVAKAEGVYFWDAQGRRYLDLASQLVNANVGHQNARVVKAIQDQAAQLSFVAPGMTTEPRALLGRKLAEITPGDLKKTFFTLGARRPTKTPSRSPVSTLGATRSLPATAPTMERRTAPWR
ncbi:MAG: aminotransferase class III-fold pyridoxal phosphate-dependent enzyme [Chloroflexota bacterium]